ncbi:hypothetical protein CK203_029547 [Vitis vinifera]|uniref:DUF4219 domain-containing protein n=1 Tax=Vitis vinifera TaxID=29760 RepID=A0A438JCC4_VITVI|nr:hypothetical protein CK203_029547 [Vitis vinifera]
MEPHQEGASIGRPHFLTGENYSHWKVRMQYFLKMQSEKVWNVVEFGWSPLKVLDREGRSTNVVKPKLEWDRSENEASENNARVMYSIFNAISMNEFCRIATCTLAKEAWDILQVTHEGTNVVKMSKLQMLTYKFETIRMDDYETFGEFHAKLMDIMNSRFRAKITTIEESKDADSLKIDERLGSFQTFEMNFASPRKAKGIALKAIKEESLSSESEDDKKMSKESNGSEGCTNFIAFATSFNEEPLLKEASSDSKDDNMSFDIAYETLYKECLSLKQKQVKWKSSKKILTNEVVLKGEKKTLLDKIAFLENLHFEVKKKCDVLKSGNQIFKDELSLRKERVTS